MSVSLFIYFSFVKASGLKDRKVLSALPAKNLTTLRPYCGARDRHRGWHLKTFHWRFKIFFIICTTFKYE